MRRSRVVVHTIGRRVVEDSSEPISEKERRLRAAHALANLKPGRFVAPPANVPDYVLALVPWRNSQLEGKPLLYEMPKRPELFCERRQAQRRAEDWVFDGAIRFIESELRRRRRGRIRHVIGALTIYDFLGEPELRDRWQQLHDAYARNARMRAPVPLPGERQLTISGVLEG